MRILGLDPSLTHYGWAVHETQGEVRCSGRGIFTTSARDLYVERYVDLRKRLEKLISEVRPDAVGIEYPVFKELYSEGMYGLFLYSSEALWNTRSDVVFFSPMQLKAHAFHLLGRPKGYGILSKSDMIEAAIKDTARPKGVESGAKSKSRREGPGTKSAKSPPWSSDQADAYWAARTAGRFWEYVGGRLSDSDLTPPERHQFARTHTITKGARAGMVDASGVKWREDERFFRWSKLDPKEASPDPHST